MQSVDYGRESCDDDTESREGLARVGAVDKGEGDWDRNNGFHFW
jgi:hypothetical protein